ncbi:hypothetical protein [Falsirhodobacter sp. alg1]|uniref:hypothetical protein n=1 Tax=Falsirhodobacter sp. alg1 TaxID=1472418 RepID=UPI00078973CD|nr:hypothetical protein [Falsirhodobacter sp. alg1]
MHPDLVAVFVEEYRRAWNDAQAGQMAARAKTERDLAQVERKIAGILSAIEDGMYEPSMKTRMEELKVEKARLSSGLAETPEPPALRLHPRLADHYCWMSLRTDPALSPRSDPPGYYVFWFMT